MDGGCGTVGGTGVIKLTTPNTPNNTHTSDNTSQSMTPSEFGYQNLNRQSNAVSLDGSPKSDTTTANNKNIYENLEQTFNNYENIRSSLNQKLTSPIRSTINIIYKSPVKKTSDEMMNINGSGGGGDCDDVDVDEDGGIYEDITTPIADKTNNLLETTFDDKMVYEQVKFYKNQITEINDMIDNGNGDELKSDGDGGDCESESEGRTHVVPNLIVNLDSPRNNVDNSVVIVRGGGGDDDDDIPMSEHLDGEDSLEFDPNNISLYENVQIQQSPILYENVELKKRENEEEDDMEYKNEITKVEMKPSNFMVRQLATKFETSPIDQVSPFDFSKPYMKKTDNNRNSPCIVRAKNAAKQLHKSTKITRSLDENAFVREFGNGIQKRLENLNQSVQQIHEIDLNNPNRRKSMDFTRPKSLNQPKRLPNLIDGTVVDTANELCKSNSVKKIGLKLNLISKFEVDETDTENDSSKFNVVKITPTTENRISLIQNNVIETTTVTTTTNTTPGGVVTAGTAGKINAEDEKSLSSIKVLENCKLDRERIEKIKEERRHQLNEKFRSESFRSNEKNYNCMKSKSKTELRDIKDTDKSTIELLRLKSKSRSDVRNIITTGTAATVTTVTKTNNTIDNNSDIKNSFNLTQRVRRISDEKNQNNTETPQSPRRNFTDNDNKSVASTRLMKVEKRGSIDYHQQQQRERDSVSSGGGGGCGGVSGTTPPTSTTPIKCSQTSQ